MTRWTFAPATSSRKDKRHCAPPRRQGLVEQYQFHKNEVKELEDLIKTQGDANKLKDMEKKGLSTLETFLLYLFLGSWIVFLVVWKMH